MCSIEYEFLQTMVTVFVFDWTHRLGFLFSEMQKWEGEARDGRPSSRYQKVWIADGEMEVALEMEIFGSLLRILHKSSLCLYILV